MKESYKALYLFSTNCLYYTFHVTIFLYFILLGVNVNFCFIFHNPRRLAANCGLSMFGILFFLKNGIKVVAVRPFSSRALACERQTLLLAHRR